jgi:hypothetical protein
MEFGQMNDALNFFKNNGYLILDNPLRAAEIARYCELYDRDRKENSFSWRKVEYQEHNCDPLVTVPEIDALIRHPNLTQPIETLLGGPICMSEICLRHMAPYDGPLVRGWHRDGPHALDHPLRTGYLHCMIYLSDVDADSHCFSISPEALDAPILEKERQLERGGVVDLHGPAGTIALFNMSVLHTMTVRPTTRERKTVQTYYGLRSGPVLSHHSTIPAKLWRDHPDEEVRGFYGNLNRKTHLFAEAFAKPDES